MRFNDTEFWTDREGRSWRLTDMSHSHKVNVLRWLERHAVSLEWADALEALAFMETMNSDDMGMDAIVDGLAARTPEEWLESTPLVRRLRRLVEDDLSEPW